MIKSFMRAVRAAQKHLQALILVTFIGAALVAPAASVAQNLGTAPATGQAVQGQTASQPEGAFLNLVNWVCNVICPVGAGIAVVATVLQWRGGRGWLLLWMTAGGLICVSGIRAAHRILHRTRSGGGLRYLCRHHWSSEQFSAS